MSNRRISDMRTGLGVALVGLVVCVGCGPAPEAGVPQAQPEASVEEQSAAVPEAEVSKSNTDQPEVQSAPKAAESPTVAQKPEVSEPTPDEVIKAIKNMGGWPKLDNNKKVVSVNFIEPSSELTDAGLIHLKELSKLERLVFNFGNNAKVSDAGLAYLKGLTKLKDLKLDSTDVSDDGLALLKGLTELKALSLYDTKVTDAGLVHLKGLTKLKFLHLGDTKVTEDGVSKLEQALPNCLIMQ